MIRRAITLVAAACVLLMLLPATPASAHAFLSESNPADGASLTTAPDVLRLAFSESVVIAATHIDLVDAEGKRYPVSNIRLVGARCGRVDRGSRPDRGDVAEAAAQRVPRLVANAFQ